MSQVLRKPEVTFEGFHEVLLRCGEAVCSFFSPQKASQVWGQLFSASGMLNFIPADVNKYYAFGCQMA